MKKGKNTGISVILCFLVLFKRIKLYVTNWMRMSIYSKEYRKTQIKKEHQ